jgi:hypothetical protein
MTKLTPKDDVCAVAAGAIEDRREPGRGVVQAAHQETLEMPLQEQGIPVEAQKKLVG